MHQPKTLGIDFLALADGQTQLIREIKARFDLSIDPQELKTEGSLGKRLISAARPDAVAWLRTRERSPEFLLALSSRFELDALTSYNLRVLVRARHTGNRERVMAVQSWLGSRHVAASIDLIEAHDGWASQVRPDLVLCERAEDALSLIDLGFCAAAVARPDNEIGEVPLVSSPFEIGDLLRQDQEDEDALSSQSDRNRGDDLRGLGRRRRPGRLNRGQGSRRGVRGA